ncbi:fibronectin type III domain-containing protein, partial [Dactylosporangium sp. NPDC000555]|uniref:fibronectin type III domain-containing protein n=1 Tax=Dactylosporangium sp. NPDC000555 TaxID=3154260 RepID=UPI00332AE488
AGTSYTFTVTAVGSGATGVSAPSAATAPVVPGPPGAPGNVAATAGAGQATVVWTPPVGGAAVGSYLVTASPGGATCTTGLTACTVTGLTDGVAYTFTVVATGTGATGTSAPGTTAGPVVPGPPGAPTAVVALAGSGSATLSWIAPAQAGAGVAGYTVTASPGGATCTTTGTTCVVSGLNGGTSYTFTVVANGISGDSPASAPSVAVLPGPPGAPGAVTAVAGDTTATVTWNPPVNQGAGVDHYTVTASPGGATCTTVANSCTVTGLANGTPYTFAVVAGGVTGTGDSAPGTTTTPVVPGPPGVPGGVTVAAGDGTAVVSWTAPAGGAAITGYTVTAAPGGQTCTTSGTTCTVTGLTNGVAYTFTVVAGGPGGTSAGSTATAPVTPGPADAPTAVTAVAGNGEASVSWTAPAGRGAGITRYHVVAAPGGASCTTTGTGCVVTGLANGTAYTFTVVADGPGGVSPASQPSAPAIPSAGAPGSPTDVTVEPGTGSATVTWTAPVVTGSGVTGYTVTASPGGETCTTTGTSCTVTGLTDGTPYTFTVVASGPGGTSAPSMPSAAQVTGPPPAPVSVSVTPGDRQLGVQWTPGAIGAGTTGVTGHTATVTPGGQSCSASGAATHCTITGLANGTPYIVSVVATGPAGTSAPTVATAKVTGPPGKPGDPDASAGASSAAVVWTAPATTGAGVSYYVVTAVPGEQTCTTSGTSCVVGGLTPGTAVTFSVVAYGPGGVSAPATAGPVLPGPPARPADVTAIAGNGSATVTWDVPADSGAGVDVSTVTASPGGASCTTSTRSCTVTGLTNGTQYTFTVVAHGIGATGSSAASAPSAAVRPSAGLPGPVTGVTVTAGNRSVLVSWSPPVVTGDGIDHYDVVSDDGQRCTTTDTSCTVTGLTNGRAYRFVVRVIGITRPDTPVPSPMTPVVIPLATTPSVPTAVTASAGIAAATVTWTAPTGGPAITGYTVTAAPGGLTCDTTGATTCLVAGLTNGQAYTFTVVAHSAGGDSGPSVPSNTVIPNPPVDPSSTVPRAPAGVTAVPGNGQAAVGWTPATGGPAVTSWTVTSVPDGRTCTTTGTTCTVAGLTNGRAYRFTVVAHGPGGDSPPSAPSTPVYPSAAPQPPTDVTVTGRYSGLVVQWTPPTDAGSGISHFTATSTAGNGRCATTTPAEVRCTMFVPIGAAYDVVVVAKGLHGQDSAPVTAVAHTRPTFPPMPPQAPTLTNADRLDSNLGNGDITVMPGEPITLIGHGFAPNSSVRFGAYSTGATATNSASVASVDDATDDAIGAPAAGVRLDILGTPTVDTGGTVVLDTTAPMIENSGEELAFVAQGVAPDGSTRLLVLWARRIGTPAPPAVPPVTPTDPITGPVTSPVVSPVTDPSDRPRTPHRTERRGAGGPASDSLAATGPPVTHLALVGVLLLLAGLATAQLGGDAPGGPSAAFGRRAAVPLP